ncbi:MAG: polyhydroxyalkanoic acid system family protein [Planctomycetota bacterium]
MPKFNVEVPHKLGADGARAKLEGFSQKLQERHADKIKDLSTSWDGDRMAFGFKTLGLTIGGQMTVEESVVRVDGELPFAAAMFKGQLTGAIDEQLRRLLG